MKMSNFLAAMIAMLIGGPLVWEFSDRTPPYSVVSGATVPPQIVRGGEYRVDWILSPNAGLHCPGTVYRYLRDSDGTLWMYTPSPASFGLMPMQFGKTRVVGSTHKVPSDAALGKAEIYIRSTYICNFTQYIWPLTVLYDPVATEIVDGNTGATR